MDNTQLPAEVLERIDLEAKQFAFFNYVSAAHNPDADLKEIKTWPNLAAASYYSIKNYMIGRGVCWPYERPPLPTEYATKLHQVVQENEDKDLLIEMYNIKHNKARALLEKVIHRHESGLLPDRLLYNEIKTFLDGKLH